MLYTVLYPIPILCWGVCSAQDEASFRHVTENIMSQQWGSNHVQLLCLLKNYKN